MKNRFEKKYFNSFIFKFHNIHSTKQIQNNPGEFKRI